MADPFGEHDASITRILADTNETLPGPTLEQTVPTNPIPFNEMAAYFGAAGTIMNRLCNRGIDRVTVPDLYSQIKGVWGETNGQPFCDQVMAIVLQYYAGHEDQRAWDAAVKARDRLQACGYIGLGVLGIEAAAHEAAGNAEVGEAAAELVRRIWFYNA